MRAIDLFSGCGGMSLGFVSAGFEVVGAFDCWQPAVDTYRRNFSHGAEAVDLADFHNVPGCDVVVGGPPCQGFSSAGLRKKADARNSLVAVFADIVARVRPSAFVFENVEGFITAAGGAYLMDLLRPAIRAGYRVHLRKVNVSNYGVPQHRKRVIAIGGLGWDPTFPSETHSSFGVPGAELANRYGMPLAPTLLAALQGLPSARSRFDPEAVLHPDHLYSPFSDDDQVRAARLLPGQTMRDLPEELWHDSFRRRAFRRVCDGTPTERRGGAPSGLRRLMPTEPSKAITGGALRDFVHPTEDRPLTIRECARLQTFPDHFVFEGSILDRVQQIGNAVPPVFASAVARQLARDLELRPKNRLPGALLSFVPTNSSGKSPALLQVVDTVSREFFASAASRHDELCL